MKIEPLHAGEHVVLTPAIRGTVGAAHEQAVQDGEEHRALQRELMPPRAGESAITLRQPVSSHSRSNTSTPAPARCSAPRS